MSPSRPETRRTSRRPGSRRRQASNERTTRSRQRVCSTPKACGVAPPNPTAPRTSPRAAINSNDAVAQRDVANVSATIMGYPVRMPSIEPRRTRRLAKMASQRGVGSSMPNSLQRSAISVFMTELWTARTRLALASSVALFENDAPAASAPASARGHLRFGGLRPQSSATSAWRVGRRDRLPHSGQSCRQACLPRQRLAPGRTEVRQRAGWETHRIAMPDFGCQRRPCSAEGCG